MATPTLTTANVVKRLSQAVANSQLGNAVRALLADVVTDVTYLTPAIVDCTASTLTVSATTHGNKTVTLNRAAGIAVTLPAATGTGNVYRFYVGTTFTGDASFVTTGGDILSGTALLYQDSADTCVGFATAADTIRLDMFDTGNTTGGLKGAHAVFTDVATDLWHVHYVSDAAGTEATPFKNA